MVAALTAVTFVAAWATGCDDSGHARSDATVDNGEVATTPSPETATTLVEAVTRAATAAGGPVSFDERTP